MDVHTWPYPCKLIGMTSKQKLAERADQQRYRSIQVKIPSKWEHVTEERIERNRRGRALCEAMIRSHRSHRQAQQSGST